jgi:hypothetical protein
MTYVSKCERAQPFAALEGKGQYVWPPILGEVNAYAHLISHWVRHNKCLLVVCLSHVWTPIVFEMREKYLVIEGQFLMTQNKGLVCSHEKLIFCCCAITKVPHCTCPLEVEFNDGQTILVWVFDFLLRNCICQVALNGLAEMGEVGPFYKIVLALLQKPLHCFTGNVIAQQKFSENVISWRFAIEFSSEIWCRGGKLWPILNVKIEQQIFNWSIKGRIVGEHEGCQEQFPVECRIITEGGKVFGNCFICHYG